MKHKIQFEKKVGLEIIGMVPYKTIEANKEGEWHEFLKLFVPRKKVQITFEWDDEPLNNQKPTEAKQE